MGAAELFSGRVAVVTGGASGIGEGLVRHAAALGMKVVVADIDAGAAAAVCADLRRGGTDALAVAVDVRDPDQVEALAEQSYRHFGAVDLLVNNAGVEQFGYLWDTPLGNWQRVLEVNVSGVFHGVRSFVPRMAATGSQSFIWNLASVGSMVSLPRQAPYLMSKHAVLGLTESLRLDIEDAGLPINVAVVLPAAVASRIFASAGLTDGDARNSAEAARDAMLALLPNAMEPLEAARVVFEQAAAGEFYLLPQPAYGAGLMQERAHQLMGRRPPAVRSKRAVLPRESPA